MALDILATRQMQQWGARRRVLRLIGALAVASVLFGPALTTPAVAGYAAIVVDATTGRVLHARNADTRNYPASLTKMMTLFLTFEALDRADIALDQPLRISRRAAGQPASKIGLQEGETISLEDAIRAIAIKSANDAATVVAEAIGGSEIKFAQMMTERAHQLGMNNTSFRNATGLPNRRQLSTARDMAILAQALLDRFPRYYGYFSQAAFEYKGKLYRNHNSLLGDYDGADGIKTGYIRASGFNLVASAERDGIRLIGVVFGGRTADRRDRQMESLLDQSWDNARSFSTASAQPVPKPVIVQAEATTAKPAIVQAVATPSKPVIAQAVATPAKPAKAAPVKVAQIDSPIPPTIVYKSPNNWGIQIGAFGGYTDAHVAAANAVRHLFNLPASASLKIQPVEQTNDTLFRARLMGMDEAAARASCGQLVRSGQECALVTPEGSELASLQN